MAQEGAQSITLVSETIPRSMRRAQDLPPPLQTPQLSMRSTGQQTAEASRSHPTGQQRPGGGGGGGGGRRRKEEEGGVRREGGG